jgi:hypothetical protein
MSLRDDLEDRFLTGGDVRDSSSRTSIDWSGLSLGVVASIVLSVVVAISEGVLSVVAWITTGIETVAYTIVGLGVTAGGIVDRGSAAAAESWSSSVDMLGALGFPVSVAVAVLMLLITIGVVSRVR